MSSAMRVTRGEEGNLLGLIVVDVFEIDFSGRRVRLGFRAYIRYIWWFPGYLPETSKLQGLTLLIETQSHSPEKASTTLSNLRLNQHVKTRYIFQPLYPTNALQVVVVPPATNFV